MLLNVTHIKDLKVTFSFGLTFNLHITTIVNTATKQLGFIRRHSNNFNNIITLKILECFFVRSYFNYNFSLCSPHQ